MWSVSSSAKSGDFDVLGDCSLRLTSAIPNESACQLCSPEMAPRTDASSFVCVCTVSLATPFWPPNLSRSRVLSAVACSWTGDGCVPERPWAGSCFSNPVDLVILAPLPSPRLKIRRRSCSSLSHNVSGRLLLPLVSEAGEAFPAAVHKHGGHKHVAANQPSIMPLQSICISKIARIRLWAYISVTGGVLCRVSRRGAFRVPISSGVA